MEEEKKEGLQENGAEVEDKKEKKSRKEEKLLRKIEELEATVAHWKNEYYRVYADTQNLRKSLEEDGKNAIKYRAEGFLEELIPALDAFYSALQAKSTSPEVENYKIGFSYIYRQIVSALESEGFKEIEPKVGDPFDPRFMHALDTEESETPGKVAKVHAKGYQLKDRLVKPVMVTATVLKAETKEDHQQENKDEQAHKA